MDSIKARCGSSSPTFSKGGHSLLLLVGHLWLLSSGLSDGLGTASFPGSCPFCAYSPFWGTVHYPSLGLDAERPLVLAAVFQRATVGAAGPKLLNVPSIFTDQVRAWSPHGQLEIDAVSSLGGEAALNLDEAAVGLKQRNDVVRRHRRRIAEGVARSAATNARSAATIALDLVDVFDEHPTVPPVRAGLAGGQVLLRDGDAFGPVVNLAARAVKVARPSTVVATTDVAFDSGLTYKPCGPQRLKGFSDQIELYRLIR